MGLRSLLFHERCTAKTVITKKDDRCGDGPDNMCHRFDGTHDVCVNTQIEDINNNEGWVTCTLRFRHKSQSDHMQAQIHYCNDIALHHIVFS